MPKLVYAINNSYEGPMCLNDDNTLGVTGFTYSLPYTINGFDYIDEFFTAANGVTYARVLFKNNLEAPQELASQGYYYNFIEVIPYPQAIPGLIITAVHDNTALHPWILQHWIIAQEIQNHINREQWIAIQIFMQQRYQTELAAVSAYEAAVKAAQAKRDLHKTKVALNKLKIENKEIKEKLKLVEQQAVENVSAKTAPPAKPAPPAKTKLSKSQKEKIRRDNILEITLRISVLSTMTAKTTDTILNLLKNLHLDNNEDLELFTNKIQLTIDSCGDLLKTIHSKNSINTRVKLGFLRKFANFSDEELIKYAKNNWKMSTQHFVTIACSLSKEQDLRNKIQTWHNTIQSAKNKQSELLAELQKTITSKEQNKASIPESQLQQTIQDLNHNKFLETIKQYPELKKKISSILKKSLTSLRISDPNMLKQFLDNAKLTRDIWLDIYMDNNNNEAVKSAALQWADLEVAKLFEAISTKNKPVNISTKLLKLFNGKTNRNGQTLLMLALEKAFPDAMLSQIFENTTQSELLSIDAFDQTLLHYLGGYNGDNYQLIKKMRDAFVKAVITHKQHLYEIAHMKSHEEGETFLHRILHGNEETHACKMMKLFFNDKDLAVEYKDIFRSVVFDKNKNDETASVILDLKNSEWSSARNLLYAFIPDIIFDYDFPYNYKNFFCNASSNNTFAKLIFSNPQRVIKILDYRNNLQVTSEKAIKKFTQKQKSSIDSAMSYLEFNIDKYILVPETATNIHKMLAKKICTASDRELEQAYNNSIFYKNYIDIALTDTLLWNKFIHAFDSWEHSVETQQRGEELTILRDAASAFATYLVKNIGKVPAAIRGFFDFNVNPGAFALLMTFGTRHTSLRPIVYEELFKLAGDFKFMAFFMRTAQELSGEDIMTFLTQVTRFVSQNHTQIGLLLPILKHHISKNEDEYITKTLFKCIDEYFTDYESFLSIALDRDQQSIIYNLLCLRGPETRDLTIKTLSKIATKRADFDLDIYNSMMSLAPSDIKTLTKTNDKKTSKRNVLG